MGSGMGERREEDRGGARSRSSVGRVVGAVVAVALRDMMYILHQLISSSLQQ